MCAVRFKHVDPVLCFLPEQSSLGPGEKKMQVQSGLVNPNQNEPPLELRIIAGSNKQIVPRK
jgi:hypothetical protein